MAQPPTGRNTTNLGLRTYVIQEYVLAGQESRIEIYRRTTPDMWEYFEVREGATRLASGPTLDLSILYADLPV